MEQEYKVEMKNIIDLIEDNGNVLTGYLMIDFGDGKICRVNDKTELIIIREIFPKEK